MPQSTSRNHRLAVILVTVLLVAAGCEITRIGPPPGVPVVPPKGSTAILSFYEIINAGKRLGFSGVVNVLAGSEVRLIKPVAVGGYGNDIFISDAGKRTIYRYDPMVKGLLELGDAGAQLVGEASQIYAAADQSFYVVDPFGNQVIRFDRTGNLIKSYKNTPNVPQPVAVAVDLTTGQVQIADGTHGYVVMFNQVGQALFATGSRGDGNGQFRMITAMSQGPDGLYVADRLRGDVQVISKDGKYLYSFGRGQVAFPNAIAVDRFNRVYVADSHDNKIKIFERGKLVDVAGGSGNGPGQFRHITDMWISSEDRLYVADSLNNRIQVLLIRPKEKGGK